MLKHNFLYEKKVERCLSKARDLTYILGARCKDGIVLVGDRRVGRGYGSYEYEDKIFSDVRDVVIGASGVVGLFDKFREEISEIAEANPDIKTSSFISEAEKIVYRLNNEYYERTRSRINLLVAWGRQLVGRLLYITPQGVGEVVRSYQVIGSGEPYGAYLSKSFWAVNLSMKQVGVLGSLIIKYIEDNELDEAVGVGKGAPQIWFIPDWPTKDEYDKLSSEQKKNLETRQVSETEQKEIMNKAEEICPKLAESLKGIEL